jgi:hypothetical protein
MDNIYFNCVLLKKIVIEAKYLNENIDEYIKYIYECGYGLFVLDQSGNYLRDRIIRSWSRNGLC